MRRRIGSIIADSTSVARLCRDRLFENRGRMPGFFKIQYVRKVTTNDA